MIYHLSPQQFTKFWKWLKKSSFYNIASEASYVYFQVGWAFFGSFQTVCNVGPNIFLALTNCSIFIMKLWLDAGTSIVKALIFRLGKEAKKS